LKANLSERLKASFISDAKRVIGVIESIIDGGVLCAQELKVLASQAHGVKPGLFNIGNNELAKSADTLEAAARAQDAEFVKQEIYGFVESLKKIVAELERADMLKLQVVEDTAFVKAQLQIIKTACEDFDVEAAQAAIDRLREVPCLVETLELLRQIEDLMLTSDFDAMEELLSAHLHQ